MPSQYDTTSNLNLVDTETEVMEEDPGPEPISDKPEQHNEQEEESEEPHLSDFQERQTRILAHYNVNNVNTTLPTLIK